MLTVYHKNIPVHITFDSSATTSFITKEKCTQLKLKILPNGKLIKLGDGCTTLAAVGEIDVVFTRDKWSVSFRAIVVESLGSEMYGGMTFLVDNDVSLRPKMGEIKILNKFVVYQTNTMMFPPQIRAMKQSQLTVRIPKGTLFPLLCTLFKTENEQPLHELSLVKIQVPEDLKDCKKVVVHPRHENNLEDWPGSQLCEIVDGEIQLTNSTNKFISIPKDAHLIGLSSAYDYNMNEIAFDSTSYEETNCPASKDKSELAKLGILNANKIDISRVPHQLREKLRKAHRQYSNVFIPDLTMGYNGHSGNHKVRLQFADASLHGFYLKPNERWTLWNNHNDEQLNNPFNRVVNLEEIAPVPRGNLPGTG